MHIDKYTKTKIGGVNAHMNRTINSQEAHIDYSKSHLNYNLAPNRNISDLDYLHQRFSEAKVFNRADVIVEAGLVLTLPIDFDDPGNRDLEYNFFEAAYQGFLKKIGGEKNVVSAYVHYDEPKSKPHLHVMFCPVVDKNGKERFCAKQMLNQQFFNTLHGDLQESIEQAGFRCRLVNEDKELTMSGQGIKNKSVKQLKLDTKLESLDKECQALQTALEELEGTIKDRQAALSAKKGFLGKITLSEREYGALLHDNNQNQLTVKNLNKQLDDKENVLNQTKQLLNKSLVQQNNHAVTLEEYNMLLDTIDNAPVEFKRLFKQLYDKQKTIHALGRDDKQR